MHTRIFVKGSGATVRAVGSNVIVSALSDATPPRVSAISTGPIENVPTNTPAINGIVDVPGAVTPESAYASAMGGAF